MIARRLLGHAGAALIAASAAASDAADVPPQLPACQACHGAAGVSARAEIPNLAGQKKDYLARQLRAFRGGERKHELMSVIAGQLADDDIRALADYWSRQPAGAAAAAVEMASAMRLPAGFPAGFTEYATDASSDGPSVSRYYANATALQAARERKALPDGSVIIVAVYASAAPDARPLSYSGMESRAGWGDAVPALIRNGNWQYGLFAADGSARSGVPQAQCLACHLPVAADSYVFTLTRLQAKAAGG